MKYNFYYLFFKLDSTITRKSQSEELIKRLIQKHFLLKSFDFSPIKNGLVHSEDCRLYCSKSYTQKMGIIVVGNRPVGVDLEFIKPRKIQLKHITLPFERELLKAGSHQEVLNFYKMWCGKEACMKVDQSSFDFINYQLTEAVQVNQWVFKSPKFLLKSFIFFKNNYVYSFALEHKYENYNSTFRECTF